MVLGKKKKKKRRRRWGKKNKKKRKGIHSDFLGLKCKSKNLLG